MRFVVLIVLFFTPIAFASADVRSVERSLEDPALEQRAHRIMQDVRCLVCAGQSLADSDATLARDMRLMIREQIVAGQTDRQIHDLIRQQYGDGVFLRPEIEGKNLVLWASPLILLMTGVAVVVAQFRFRRGLRSKKT